MQTKAVVYRDIHDRGVVAMKNLTCDTLTPVQAYDALAGDGDGFLLESIPGTYSFLGRFAPGETIEIGDRARDPWARMPLSGPGLRFKQNTLPPFIGGYVGYVGYDMIRGIEDLERPEVASGFPDALLGRVDTLLVFNHLRQGHFLLHTIAEAGLAEATVRRRAEEAFAPLEEALLHARRLSVPMDPGRPHVQGASLTEGAFLEAVDRARGYIRDGEIIQAVLSRRMDLESPLSPFDVYRRLRRINPSPYLFFIRMKGVTLIGSSPEVLVRLKGDRITTLPIAGTRPRGSSVEEDADLAADLLRDAKERAEHLMLLDLARNDVGRIARPGSVRVTRMNEVKYFSHVMHIVSCVRGVKCEGMTGIDVLKACFPAGTVSGAPKVRAMQIIDELEGRCRGPYAGAVGYLSLCGNIDTGIAIRTIFMNGGTYAVQAGAGIVWDSDPASELQEIDNKLMALSKALGGLA